MGSHYDIVLRHKTTELDYDVSVVFLCSSAHICCCDDSDREAYMLS